MISDLTIPSHLTRESEKNKTHMLKTCSIMVFIIFFKLIRVYILVH